MSAIPSIRSSTTVSAALAHATTFLTRPLTSTIAPARFIALQHALSTILTPYLSSSWSPSDPNRGSGRRCLTLSPSCTPPKPIFMAAKQANIEWRTWMKALGGREFDLFIDPGRVRVRFAGDAEHRLVWTASASAQPSTSLPALSDGLESEKEARVEIRTAIRATMARAARVRLSQILSLRTDLACFANSPDGSDSDAEDSSSVTSSDSESLFSSRGSISSRSSATSVASSWPSPKMTHDMPFITFTPASPVKSDMFASSIHMASMHKSSTYKIRFPTSSAAKTPAPMTTAAPAPYRTSRRENARQRRAGIVTIPAHSAILYDGGRTTVLGGGVKLGGVKAVLAASS